MIRNAYLKKVEERLAELGDEIESLRRRAESASAETGENLRRQVEVLRSKADAAGEKIRAVRKAGVTGWGRLKKGADDALDDLRKGIDGALGRFRKTGSDRH